MKFTRFPFLLPLFFLLLKATGGLSFAAPEYARLQTPQILLGGNSARTLNPSGLAVDRITGKVYVADPARNRVLRFGDHRMMNPEDEPEAVLGQADFAGEEAGTGAARMSDPSGLQVDAAGRLWVADSGNHRVLRFDNAASLPNGAPAAGVLGQPGFGTGNAGLSAAAMNSPRGVCVDGAGRAWVADTLNNRVLRFDNAAAKPNGVAANAVLGQPDFSTGAAAAADDSSFNLPMALLSGAEGGLWVADMNNNRVLRFDNAAAKPNGAPANSVLGQPDFISDLPSPSAAGLRFPSSLALDAAGRLWVGDYGNLRLVRYDGAAALPSGAPAAALLGQADWGQREEAGAVIRPCAAAFFFGDDDTLWVADFRGALSLPGRLTRYFPVVTLDAVCGLNTEGRFFVTFRGVFQRNYQIQTSDGVQPWVTLETLTAAGPETTWTHAQPPAGRRFFRVVELR